MEYKFDYTDLLGKAFGFKPAIYVPVGTVPTVIKPPKQSLAQTGPAVDSDLKSYWGTPLIMPVELDGYRLPNEPLIELNGSKTIIKTPLDGRNGTFKELYSLNDYQMTVRGLAIDDENPEEYPENIIRKLRHIFEKAESIKIVCDLTTIFNIRLVAIEDLKLPSLEGFPGVQPYEFTLLSDQEFDLELKK